MASNRQDYTRSGFNAFFSRSIDSKDSNTLPSSSSTYRRGNSQEVNYDNSPTTGTLGSKVQIGDSIVLDGTNKRISVIEGTNEVVRIGELDG